MCLFWILCVVWIYSLCFVFLYTQSAAAASAAFNWFLRQKDSFYGNSNLYYYCTYNHICRQIKVPLLGRTTSYFAASRQRCEIFIHLWEFFLLVFHHQPLVLFPQARAIAAVVLWSHHICTTATVWYHPGIKNSSQGLLRYQNMSSIEHFLDIRIGHDQAARTIFFLLQNSTLVVKGVKFSFFFIQR